MINMHMYVSMKVLFISLLLLPIGICVIYNVKPDDYNTTCDQCHTLQYYQLNISKYFTSNTQLLFLPGIHYLNTDFIIQNVHNFSLIGSTANGSRLHSVIQCTKLVSIEMINIVNLTVCNLMIQIFEISKNNASDSLHSLVIIADCRNVLLDHLKIHKIMHYKFYSLLAINVLGKSHFSHILCHNISLYYNETDVKKEHSTLLIDHYQTQNDTKYYNKEIRLIELFMQQVSYKVTVQLSHITIKHKSNPFISVGYMSEESVLIIANCSFQFNHFTLFTAVINYRYNAYAVIYFLNCQFLHNSSPVLIAMQRFMFLSFTNCIFIDNLKLLNEYTEGKIIIIDTTFAYSKLERNYVYDESNNLIALSNGELTLAGTVTFDNIHCANSIIYLESSIITINGLVKFSNNYAIAIVSFQSILNSYPQQYLVIKNSASVEISKNYVCTFFKRSKPDRFQPKLYPFCFFQYISNETFTKDSSKHSNFSITIHNNKYEPKIPECDEGIPIANCQWLLQSTFEGIFPLDINKHYIQYYNNNNNSDLEALNIKQSTLCICNNEMNYDCHISDLGYLYPGQTLAIHLHSIATKQYLYAYNSDTEVVVKTDINLINSNPCIVLSTNEHRQFINTSCTEVRYTIAFSSYEWCEIYLKFLSDNDDKMNIFNIRKLKCPPGFAEVDKICQCDPVITRFKVVSCNINDQTILRTANSWISAATHTGDNDSYTYHISLNCPLRYCLSHSSRLNFSTPNSQCQFNRSGLLCGQCQQGLSSVFGSPYCQKCSNIYIILIIPIAIAGVVLVFIIFYLNLTVTDGNINAFILYTNIISINIPAFFPSINEFVPTYAFISLANLDLGVQTCFYNGMDDYAKMWLQLVFPLYLISIAMALIITSRYSTTIQRLTARRALPVLATLFLLSYTKTLHTVSNVLFFYTSITHLPSKYTTLVWSVDPNVLLFGVQFSILFIVCVIILLILIMFNIILLFTRTLSRLRFINKFKPLLDAYQGPYKDKFYYWTGLQLLIRAVFFGLSSLDRNINLLVGILLLSIFEVITGAAQPFTNKIKNYQELILIVNLHGLFAISLYTQDVTNMTTVNIMITLSAVQIALIFAYHIITYGCGGVIRNRIHLCVNCVSQWITRLQNRIQHQSFNLQDSTRDRIPEVTFDYHELREPLVGLD